MREAQVHKYSELHIRKGLRLKVILSQASYKRVVQVVGGALEKFKKEDNFTVLRQNVFKMDR